MIIGLTGRIASGKGVISELFKKKGFEYLSLSDEIRKEAKKRGIKAKRDKLQDLGNLIRKKEGAGALAKRIIKKIKRKKNYVIDGIRNTGEIKELRKKFGKEFYLISVGGNLKVRWKRVQKRGRESDPKTFEEFVKIDKRDYKENIKNGQEVKKCMELADFKIINNSSIEKLKQKTEKIYNQIKCY